MVPAWECLWPTVSSGTPGWAPWCMAGGWEMRRQVPWDQVWVCLCQRLVWLLIWQDVSRDLHPSSRWHTQGLLGLHLLLCWSWIYMAEDLWELRSPSLFSTSHKDWFLTIPKSMGNPSKWRTLRKALGHREPQYDILEEHNFKESWKGAKISTGFKT